MFKTVDQTVWNFSHSNFDIVSDFDIRISNLNRDLFRYSKFGFHYLRSLRLCSGQAWRPFGGVYPDNGRAQDRLGEKIFVEVILLNILSVTGLETQRPI